MSESLFDTLGSHAPATLSDAAAMRSISHALERTVADHRLSATLFVGFQRLSNFLTQEITYRRLARSCAHVCVWGVADVPAPPIAGISMITIPPDHPLAAEWFLLIDAPDFASALISKEIAPEQPGAERGFLGFWSHDPQLVERAMQHLSQRFSLDYSTPVVPRSPQSQLHYIEQVLQQVSHQHTLQVTRTIVDQRTALARQGLAASDTPLLLLDERKIVTAASPSACALLQVSPDELIGSTLREGGGPLLRERDPTSVSAPRMTLLSASDNGLLAISSMPLPEQGGRPGGWVLRFHESQAPTSPPPDDHPSLPLDTLRAHYLAPFGDALTALGLTIGTSRQAQPLFERMERIYTNLDRQLQRMSQLQQISLRPHAPEPMDLRALLQSTAAREILQMPNQHIRLQLQVPDQAIMVPGEYDHLALALGELLQNCYIHAEGCTLVRLTLHVHDGLAYMQIADNGAGMSEQAQHRALAPFRPHTPAQRAGSATMIGYGLVMVRTIVKRTRGFMRIRSTLGKGCQITLILPLA